MHLRLQSQDWVCVGLSPSGWNIWMLQFFLILPCETARAQLGCFGEQRALFKSIHKFSIGLRSGLWLSHPKNLHFVVFQLCRDAFGVVVLLESKSPPKLESEFSCRLSSSTITRLPGPAAAAAAYPDHHLVWLGAGVLSMSSVWWSPNPWFSLKASKPRTPSGWC